MKYYMAPMEGLTTYNFRRCFNKYFEPADKYFTPFISNSNLNSRERNDILPEHNEGMEVVPQILSNKVSEFLSISKAIASYGYDTVNLNLGCPSGTVVSRNRGAGFLSVPDELESFLDEIFEKSDLKISIKTRIGMNSIDEWDKIISIYKKYPLEELIIHPRLQCEGYGGSVHLDAYEKAANSISCPLCYNGDIIICSSRPSITCNPIIGLHNIESVMIGRGMLRNPGIFGELKGLPSYSKETLKAFHDELLEDYQSVMSGDKNTLFKMKDLWAFLAMDIPGSEKALKHIRKATHIADYKVAVNEMLSLI